MSLSLSNSQLLSLNSLVTESPGLEDPVALGNIIVDICAALGVGAGVVWRPGETDPSGRVYADWEAAHAALKVGQGPNTLFLDGSKGSLSIPAGTWLLEDITLRGILNPKPTLTISDGVKLPGARKFVFVRVLHIGAASAVDDIGAGSTTIVIENASLSSTTAAMFKITDIGFTGLSLKISKGTCVENNGFEVFDIDAAITAVIGIVAEDEGNIKDDTIRGGAGGSTLVPNAFSVSAAIGTNHANFNGSVVFPDTPFHSPRLVMAPPTEDPAHDTGTLFATQGNFVRVDPSGGGVVVRLPAARGVTGEMTTGHFGRGVQIEIKNITSDATSFTVERSDSDLIDDAVSISLSGDKVGAVFRSDGVSNWWVVSRT